MALHFAGNVATDRVVIANHAAIQSLDTLTLAAWILKETGTDPSGPMIVSKGGFTFRLFSGGRLFFQASRWATTVGQWNIASSTRYCLADTLWYHVAATYNYGSTSNDPILYVNGVPIPSSDITKQAPVGTKNTDTAQMVIGNENGGSWNVVWRGRIAEFAVFNTVLTPAQIINLAQGSSPLSIGSACVSYFPLVGLSATERNQAGTTDGSTTGATAATHDYPSRRLIRSALRGGL